MASTGDPASSTSNASAASARPGGVATTADTVGYAAASTAMISIPPSATAPAGPETATMAVRTDAAGGEELAHGAHRRLATKRSVSPNISAGRLSPRSVRCSENDGLMPVGRTVPRERPSASTPAA